MRTKSHKSTGKIRISMDCKHKGTTNEMEPKEIPVPDFIKSCRRI